VKAGALQHVVTIQALSAGSPQQKPSGELDTAWADYLTGVSAEWVTLRGNTEHHPEVRGIWRIRWRDGITAGMRVVHGSRYYDILFVPPYDRDGRRIQLDLECSEGVIDG
jgi:head-tail adaptor